MKIEATSENFAGDVLGSDVPVLVDFWAEWCMPCKMIAPLLEEISAEYDGKLTIATLNVDANPSIASDYDVVSIPSLLLFKNGELVRRHVGAAPREAIVEIFADQL